MTQVYNQGSSLVGDIDSFSRLYEKQEICNVTKMKKIFYPIYSFFFRLRNKIYREFMSIFHLRPSSYPYITGDGFRKIADHIYDETKKCRAEDIRDGEVVFINSSLVEKYFDEVHKNSNARYILISHNSDQNIEEQHLKFIDDKLIRWYAQNVLVYHEKLHPIPFGLDNFLRYHTGIPNVIKKYSLAKKFNRKNRIIYGFSIVTNPVEREKAYGFLASSQLTDKLKWTDNPDKYFDSITDYKFIAAPDGNGHDDPRRWESMYVKIVPIIIRSVSMDYFKSLNLPLWIVDDWEELKGYTEDELAKKYDEIITSSSREALHMDVWLNKIRKDQASLGKSI